MMNAPLIPLQKINKLRCFNCKEFLLGGPVHLNPNDGSSLCGRCRHLSRNIFHNKAYEALASMFRYPCLNWEKNCDQTLLWNEIFVHESECRQPGCCKCCRSMRRLPLDDVNGLPAFKVPMELLDRLKCIICYGFISCGPILLTPDGENICNRCVATQENLYNEKRNLPFEMLADILVFPCKFYTNGCPASFKFGCDIFNHENQCDYQRGNSRDPPEREFVQKQQGGIKHSKLKDKKERGVIQTHAGHVFGTITPNFVPAFAPPKTKSNQFDINKDLIKSLQKKQHKQRNRVDDGQVFEEQDFPSEGNSISSDILNPRHLRSFDNGGYHEEPSQYSMDINRLARQKNPRLSHNYSMEQSVEHIPRAHTQLSQQNSFGNSEPRSPREGYKVHPMANEIRQFNFNKTQNRERY